MSGGGVVGYMINDVFVLCGNVVDGEIERFEIYVYVNYFFVGVQYFDRLFEGNISVGVFDNQVQVVFIVDFLVMCDYIFG